jgi:hypothetical protein
MQMTIAIPGSIVRSILVGLLTLAPLAAQVNINPKATERPPVAANASVQVEQQVRKSTRSREYIADSSEHIISASEVPLDGRVEGILACDLVGTTCRVRNMPLISQGDPRVSPEVLYMGNDGCYDTSIVTVTIAALANRSKALQPSGRTKMFDELTGNQMMPKEIAQLSQQYRWASVHSQETVMQEHGNFKGKAVQPLYFDEVLADFGKIQQSCDPYTYGNCTVPVSNNEGNAFRTFVSTENITNEYVINLMKSGYVTMIAYGRYRPSIEEGPQKFVFHNRHKVVFSGFQPGKYPLLINEVGSGNQVRARLTTDLSERMVGLGSHGPEVRSTDTLIHTIRRVNPRFVDYPTPTRIFIEYEGERKVNEEVYFIEHIDALRIKTQ